MPSRRGLLYGTFLSQRPQLFLCKAREMQIHRQYVVMFSAELLHDTSASFVERMHDRAAVSNRGARKDFSSPSNAPTSPPSHAASEQYLSPLTSPAAGGLYLPKFSNPGPSRSGGNIIVDYADTEAYYSGYGYAR